MKLKKIFSPVVILLLFLVISIFLFVFKKNVVDIFAFFLLIILGAAITADLVIVDLVALLVSLLGLVGMSFTEGWSRILVLAEIAATWGIVWLSHLFNDRLKHQQAEDSHELSDMSTEIEKVKKELSVNKQKFEKIGQRIVQYKNLTIATKELTKITDLQKLKSKLSELVRRILNCDNVRITTFLPDDDKPPDIFDAWVVKKQIPLLIQNTLRDWRFDYSLIPKTIKSIIAVPLYHDKSIIGIVRVDSDDENRFSQEDIGVVSILVNITEMTIENLHLLDKTKELSIIDGLTGVYVRKFLDERLQQELLRASRFKTTLALAFCDIDHFKKFNDTFGHQQGDEVLKRFANILRQHCRETDIIARYGGEEFAIILPETSKEESIKIAEQIRTSFQLPSEKTTVSIGLSFFSEDAIDHSQLIRKADERLYRAKETGRNKTVWTDF
ncbi:MAG: sensor domain-containing diguanylate cyclase [Elusimicrobiota bacterium]